MTYIIPAGDAASFNLLKPGYTVPAGDAVDFNLAPFEGGAPVPSRVPGVIASVGTRWRRIPARKEAAASVGYREAPEKPISRSLNARSASKRLEPRTGVGFGKARELPRVASTPWSAAQPRERTATGPYDNGLPKDQASRVSRWARPSAIVDPFTVGLHENGHPRDVAPVGRWYETDLYGRGVPEVSADWRRGAAYVSPVAALLDINTVIPRTENPADFVIDTTLSEPEARIAPTDPLFRSPAGVGEIRDNSPRLPWGPGGFRDTTLNFTYPVDNTPVPQPGEVIVIPIRRFYVVSNSAQIVRVSDGRDIPAQQVSLSISSDSFAWTMQAALSGSQALALVEGTDAEPVEVDVIVNGVTWRIVVDGWSLQETAAGRSGAIQGRSRSAYLAAPYAAVRDYQEGSGLNMSQLAGQEVSGSWTVNWTAANWFVPSGVWSYQKQSPIAAIGQLAKSAGAFVQTDRSSDLLTIAPLYSTAPWLWDAAVPNYQLPRALLLQRSSQKKPGQGKNALFVHGGPSSGILRRVLIQGTAGNLLLPTIVDNLCVDDLAARHQGIVALAAARRQSTERHELPLDSGLGGLMLPGSLVAVGDNSTGPFNEDWRGMIRGTTVNAQAARGGARGVNLKVRQSIDIERHFED